MSAAKAANDAWGACFRASDGNDQRERAGRCAVAGDAHNVGAGVRSIGRDRRNSPEGLTAPANASKLFLTIGNVTVEGGFPELAADTAAITAKIQGRQISVAEIFAAANAIEQAYAARGYVLVRVAVPPQQLKNGGRFVLS